MWVQVFHFYIGFAAGQRRGSLRVQFRAQIPFRLQYLGSEAPFISVLGTLKGFRVAVSDSKVAS